MKAKRNLSVSKKFGFLKLSAIFALAIVMLSSGLMIAKLNANVGVAQASVGVQSSSLDIGGSAGLGGGTENGIGGETNITPDYSYLATKYLDRFSQNSNGTINLDLSISGISGFGIIGSTMIDDADRGALNEYSKFLDNFNQQIADGKLYHAEDGNYHLVDNDASSRWINGGKYEFWFKTVAWIIPVGIHAAMGTIGAILFGAITFVMAKAATKDIIKAGEKSKLIAALATGTGVSIILLNEQVDVLWGVLFGIFATGLAIGMALAAFSGGIGAIVDAFLNAVLGILASYLFDNAGLEFFTKGFANLNRAENTVYYESNLLLLNRNVWVGVY